MAGCCIAWALWGAGCAPSQAIRPPFASPEMDEDARKALYERYQLTCEIHERSFVLPLFVAGTRIKFTRSDGGYLPSQVDDLMESYPETRSLKVRRWDKFGVLLGVDVAAIGATQLLFQPIAGLYSLIAINDAAGALVVLPIDTAGPIRLANAYNRGLATELGLEPPPEPVIPWPRPAGEGWMRGSLCFEGFMGMSVQSRSELDHFYGTALWDAHRPWAPSLIGLSMDYALSDRWQAGVEWEPFLPKRARVTYTSGNTDTWTLDAMGILGRIRFFTPLNSSLGLVVTVAAGRYSLSGAKLATTYWYGTRGLSGSVIGGYGTVGLERVMTKSCGIHVGIGYRSATIDATDQGMVWAQTSRNDVVRVNHSGPFFATAYRYYWGVARGAAPAAPAVNPVPSDDGDLPPP